MTLIDAVDVAKQAAAEAQENRYVIANEDRLDTEHQVVTYDGTRRADCIVRAIVDATGQVSYR